MRKLVITLLSIAGMLQACQSPQEKNTETETEMQASEEVVSTLKPGMWRVVLQAQEQKIPFQMEVKKEDDQIVAYLINDQERIKLDEIAIEKDSITITLHIFDAVLAGKWTDEHTIQGVWIKYGYQEPYQVPFEAKYGEDYRFEDTGKEAAVDFSGKWAVEFKDGDDTYPAIGVFTQKDKRITGTFLTTTGDYRYLEGIVEGNEMQVSTFDGSHGFLFKASLEGENIKGGFWSGKHSNETFTGHKDENALLPDANSLTFLKEGYESLEFSFPNLEGKKVSLKDDKYKDKVVLVQIFGTWCPNCMDETAFYAPYYEKNKERGLEIIGLAYERSPDFEKAKERVEKMIKRFHIKYDFLIAGVNNKLEAAKTLPMLTHVLSFPTSIYIDRSGKVRKIHTGFTGPGTGKYYEKFVHEFHQTMEELLEEKI